MRYQRRDDMRSTHFSRRRLAAAAATMAVAAALAGCGTDSGGDDAGGETMGGDDVAALASAELQPLYGNGSFTDPATDGPPAQPGYTVALVNSGVQNPTGTVIVEAAREATEAIGWDLTVYDGKYDPAEYQEGIRQAIAQGVDAIWLYSIDCPLVQTALEEARQAGIPVVSHEAADCSDVDPEAESYFERTLPFAEGDFIGWGEGLGEAQAIWLLAQLGEEANIIEVSVPELVVTNAISMGFNAKMEEMCPTCEVTTLEVQLADLGPALQEKIATALLRTPEANGMALSYDDLAMAGGAAAVMESGRNESLLVVAGTDFAPTMDLIRNNAGLNAGFVNDEAFSTWATVDMLNRMFAGVENASTGGPGLAMVDRENGLTPEGEDWKLDIDYRSAYKEVWGVS